MQILEFIFNNLPYLIAGVIGVPIALALLFVVIAILFGKKVEKQYDLEAEFHDGNGKEFADFDLKSWRYEKEGGDFQLTAKFKWRDSRLALGSNVEVLLESQLILQGDVQNPGKIRLSNQHIVNQPESPQVGQQCQIRLNGEVVLEKALAQD